MRPRWLIIGLLVSVALNLFLVGVGAGIVALGVRIASDNGGARPGAFFWATQAMSQPARGDVRRALLGYREQLRPEIERSLALRVQGWSGLAAAKPDVAAIKQALAQGRQVDFAARTKVEEGVVDQVAGLPPADRTAYAAGMRRTLMAAAPSPRPGDAR